jgi:hypothetical protein
MFYFSPLALSALLVSTLVSLTSSEATCGAEKQTVCDSLFRQCEVTFNGTEQCNLCIEGYIGYDRGTIIEYLDRIENLEQAATCIDIATIDLVALQSFNDEFGPQYRNRTDGLGLTDEERVVLLIQVAYYISDWNNQVPPPEYYLTLNEFSLDGPGDKKDRTGYTYVDVTGTEDELPPITTVQSTGTQTDAPLLDKIDWVEEGAVTYVKNQGRCGCCWAVSLAGVLEGHAAVNAIKQGGSYLQSLSFQQLISCDTKNGGCNGGNLYYAMQYSVAAGAIRLDDYPYTDGGGTTTEECLLTEGDTELAVVAQTGKMIDYNDDMAFDQRLELFKNALATTGPIAMVIKSSCQTISNYRSGILDDDGDCACDNPNCIDHAVLMVGFDDTAAIPFLKMKNSWGTGWGENGYFRVSQREANGRYGLFGMLAHGIIPTNARNVTGQVYEEPPPDDDDLEWWVYLLIAIAAVCLLCCICGLVFQLFGSGGK